MKNKYTILFATDSGYMPHLATALYSLLDNNRILDLRVVVLTGCISLEDQKNLKLIAKRFDVSLEFKLLEDNLFDGLILGNHFQKSNYYRLFAAEMLTESVCLYLDADIVVTGALNDLLETNLNDCYVAAVEDPGFDRHQELFMQFESKYFNSGVMLINLEKWRSMKLREAVISFVKINPNAIHFVDQCGLNGVIDGRWVELNPRFNFQSAMLNKQYAKNYPLTEFPTIVHYTGSSKPWHLNNKHPYKRLYWRYRNQTPYKKLISDDFSVGAVLRYITPHFIKKFIKYFIGISK